MFSFSVTVSLSQVKRNLLHAKTFTPVTNELKKDSQSQITKTLISDYIQAEIISNEPEKYSQVTTTPHSKLVHL